MEMKIARWYSSAQLYLQLELSFESAVTSGIKTDPRLSSYPIYLLNSAVRNQQDDFEEEDPLYATSDRDGR